MPSTAQMSHAHFWLCTIGLLLVWVVVIATASPYEAKTPGLLKFWGGKNQAQEQRLENNCKSLCEQCGCIGFYCGEQCLCEYNKLNNGQHNVGHSVGRNEHETDTKLTRNIRSSDRECITRMQREANNKKLPYEVLIQGPTADRFIRTAMQLAQDLARTALAATTNSAKIDAMVPQKRSTISIYRPFTPSLNNMLLPAQASDARKTQLKDPLGRLRRSTDHLDWFTDFANTLVRPAPRRKSEVSGSGSASSSGGANKKRETQQRSEEDATREKPESWFTDHPNLLLRPAPLFRRKAAQKPTAKAARIAASTRTKEEQEEEVHDDSSYMNNKNNNNNYSSKKQKHVVENESRGDSMAASAAEDEEEEEEEEEEMKAPAPLAPMRKALKNTIRNIQESELGQNIRQGLRTRLHDNGGDLMSNPFDSGNLELLPKRFRNDFVEVFDSWMKGQQVTDAPMQQPEVPARAAPSNIMLPWLRPVHFLQRVQQALN